MSEKRYTYSQLNNGQYSVNYTTFVEIYGEENMFHSRICEVNNKKQAQNVVNLLNEYGRLSYIHGLLHDEYLELEIKLREAESDIASLKEENEQLQRSGLMAICKEQKKQIKDLKCRINNIYATLREEKCGDFE